MVFDYSHRSASGAVVEGSIEAANRADCYARLKELGINPLSVNVGKNKSIPRRPSPGGGMNTIIYGGLICLILIGVVIWFLVSSSKGSESKTAVVKSNSPTTPANTNKTVGVSNVNIVPEQPAPKDILVMSNKEHKDKVSSTVADTNNVIYAPTSGGKKKVRYLDGREGEIGAVKIFNRPFEQSLLAATRPGGSSAMLRRALLMYTDKQIIAMLKEPVNIDANKDAEGVIERKLNVQVMKEQMLKYIENGGSVESAFEFYAKQSAEERAFQTSARKELGDLVKAGDDQAIIDFVANKNKELKQKGLPELRLPTYLQQPKQTEVKGNENG